jgi:hypothetical protein
MDRLVSKIFAGGLSAGVFLLWWPEHVHGEGLLQLVLRGLLWTLTFELLLFAFGPAEVLIAQRLKRRITTRRDRVKNRLAGVPAPARAGGAVALACCGLAAPLALLADAPHELAKQVEGPRVVKQVIVERPVVHKKVIVRKVVAPATSPHLQSTGAAPSVPASQVVRPTAGTQAKVASERAASTAKKTTAKAPAATVEKTAAATTKTAPQAATKTAPAPGVGTPAAQAQPEAGPAQVAPAPAP